MIRHYEGIEYFEGEGLGYASYASQRRSLLATFGCLLRELRNRGMAAGVLLDVGCGHGYFLEAARGDFARRMGTDLSSLAADKASAYADSVYVGGIAVIPTEVRFDCIVALHVIEHIYDPRAFVESLFERLLPKGWLVIATPDIGSVWRRILGIRWPSFKMPEHVVFFDHRTLDSLLRSLPHSGRPVRIPYPHAFPLAVLADKLKLTAPRALAGRNVWIPGTTLCLAVQRL